MAVFVLLGRVLRHVLFLWILFVIYPRSGFFLFPMWKFGHVFLVFHCIVLYIHFMDDRLYAILLWTRFRIVHPLLVEIIMATKNPVVSDGFGSLIRKLEMTEKRQVECLEDTRKQLEALRDLVKKQA